MPSSNAERAAALNAASNAADKRLREAHADEYNRLKAEEAAQRGVEWAPRKSDEEKAAEQLAGILVKFPHLAETVGTPTA